MQEKRFDIVIVGGSLGGVAAAIRASAMGAEVCLIEESDWLGGQYSSQGLTRGDEVESVRNGVGCTKAYYQFRRRSSAYYIENFTLSATGKRMGPDFDPGAPETTFETTLRIAPRAAHDVLQAMLDLTAPRVALLRQTRIQSAETDGNKIVAVSARSLLGAPVRLSARFFLDATDLGDLLAVANIPYRVGAESKAEYAEPNAPREAHPEWIQPITVPIAVRYCPNGSGAPIEPPYGYEAICKERPFVLPSDLNGVRRIAPYRDSVFNYRQFIAAVNFADPAFLFDITTLNDDNNDYKKRSLPTGNPDADAAIIAAARDRSRAYLNWLQTACPRDDGPGHGYPELRIAQDAFGTYDGTAPRPYIRESRRMIAATTVRQQDIATAGPRAKLFRDSCGIGWYHLDMHTLEGMDGYEGPDAQPFQIPLGALVCPTVNNFAPACKNLGVTHITNSAFRVHPIEWSIGEAAGLLAAFCVSKSTTPQSISSQPSVLREFQHALLDAGIPLYWWSDVSFTKPELFEPTHLVGVAGYMPAGPLQPDIDRQDKLAFRADLPLSDPDRRAIEQAVGETLTWPSGINRGDAARWLAERLKL